jgi:preprotein translocase subunit SecA/nephrocystin-3
LAIWEKVLGAGHPDVAISYFNIGSIYDDLFDYAKALENHQKALAIREKVLGANHLLTISVYESAILS